MRRMGRFVFPNDFFQGILVRWVAVYRASMYDIVRTKNDEKCLIVIDLKCALVCKDMD